jgi:acyl carrier protein
MTTIDDFVALVRDELGLDIDRADVARDLDELPGWDSLQLLTLATALERSTGRAIVLPDILEATSLADIYAVAADA